MKRIFFLLIVITAITYNLNAQDDLCVPDTTYLGSGSYINPEPYHPRLNPNAGILPAACVNHDYSYTFTAVVPDSLLGFTLDSIVIEKDGIFNIPTGIDYKCNPPNCNFPSGSIGCFELKGKPDPGNVLTYYDLKMKVKIVVGGGLLTINDTLPDLLNDSTHYFLPLLAEDCLTAVNEESGKELSVQILNNPVAGVLNFSILTKSTENTNYSLYDLAGREIFNKNIIVDSFANIRENIMSLKPGIYFLKVRQKKQIITKKISIFN